MQWAAIGFPAALLGLFEFFRHRLLEHQLPGVWGNFVGALVVAAGVYGFIRYYAATVAQVEQALGRTRAEAAVLAERQRIGREMHDSVAQALFHMRVRLQEMDRLLADGALPEARRELSQLDTQVGAAYDHVRRVIADLRLQAEAEDTGEALRRAATAAAHDLGLELALTVGAVPRMGAREREHLAAILSEALTNARRHGKATAVQVTADAQGLVIADNGTGFDPARTGAALGDGAGAGGRSAGFGLMILAERAQMLGAALTVDSAPGRGARLTLTWRGTHADSSADRR